MAYWNLHKKFHLLSAMGLRDFDYQSKPTLMGGSPLIVVQCCNFGIKSAFPDYQISVMISPKMFVLSLLFFIFEKVTTKEEALSISPPCVVNGVIYTFFCRYENMALDRKRNKCVLPHVLYREATVPLSKSVQSVC